MYLLDTFKITHQIQSVYQNMYPITTPHKNDKKMELDIVLFVLDMYEMLNREAMMPAPKTTDLMYRANKQKGKMKGTTQIPAEPPLFN